LNAPLTSSCGRLCDAVAAMLNIGRIVSYEGEAAVRLEAIIERNVTASYDFVICEHILDPAPMLKSIYNDLTKGVLPSIIAAKFHNTLINAFASVCEDVAGLTGVKQVCLSGGVFQNAYLLEGLLKTLTAKGLQAFWPQKIPANDAGISLGQVMIAYHNSRC
jgi:hydrogenase maturation protein HypF